MSEAPLLELRAITKRFPGIVANDAVDFDLGRREVHALLGENGAGKSTLMNVLYGLYQHDEGQILMNGKPVSIRSPKDAINLGIGMVHQHFMLIPVMTVAENIVLATEPTKAGIFLDYDAAVRRVEQIARTFSFAIDPRARVENIGVGQQQRVEILKALYRGAEILILDEPTAVLTPQESRELFGILRSLVAEGMSVIFISHKLKEVLEIADRVTVLRRGKKIETLPREGATTETLARLMVGREVLLRVEKKTAEPGEPLLRVEGLSARDERGLDAVRDVSFDVRAGEIVGIAGIDGNGQSELVEALTGLNKPTSGRVLIGDKDVTGRGPRVSFDAGEGHIPEDRQRRGLVLDFTLAENIALHDYRRRPDSRFGWLFPRPPRPACPASAQGVRRPRRRSADARCSRCPAGISRRWSSHARSTAIPASSSPPSRPAASTSARSSSSTAGSSKSGTKGGPSYSFPSRSTRFCPSPTASSSSTRAGSWPSTGLMRRTRSSELR